MARIITHCLHLKAVFHMILFLILKTWHFIANLKVFLSSHFYKISFSSSVCLLLVNVIIFFTGCRPLHSNIFSLNLPHGYLPTFPHHFYPSVNHETNHSENSGNAIDQHLFENVIKDPLNHQVPPVVHIVWCDHGSFSFANYLSVVAAFKMFKPSVLYLHISQDPELDPDGYFQFLPDLIRDIPVFFKTFLKFPLACSGSIHEQKEAYFKIVGSTGGVAINGKTLVVPSQSFKSLLDKSLSIALLNNNFILLVSAHPGILKGSHSQESLEENKFQDVKCQTANNFSWKKDHPCVYIVDDIFPFQIFRSETDFAALARWLGYGTSNFLVSQPVSDEIVPNVIHYVWLGKRQFDFFAYLSLLSSLYVLRAESVYIHGEEPLGEIWAKVKHESRIKVINRDFPNTVYGDPIKRFVSHASDYLRGDVLLRYGGVYADWDVLFLKELPSSVRRHHTTVSVDWPETGYFPDVLNLGVMVAAPGAEYLRFFLESYRWYLDSSWSYNAIHIPYKIYEKNPRSLNIDRHLQVLCAEDNCHASWIPGFKEDNTDHLNTNKISWQKDAVAIHWTHPDPLAFKDLDSLLKSKTVEADIGKFILKKAKLLPEHM